MFTWEDGQKEQKENLRGVMRATQPGKPREHMIFVKLRERKKTNDIAREPKRGTRGKRERATK